MKKTVMAMALLGFLTLVALSWRVEGTTDHTYVVNQSSKWIVATITYNFPFATPSFTNRIIAPYTLQGDEYNDVDCNIGSSKGSPSTLNVYLWVSGSSASQNAIVGCDQSVLGVDNYDKRGVDVSKSAYGQLYTPSQYLFSIFP